MRPFRDILAEAMRRERLGLMRPLWGDADEEFRETWRRRADFVIRVLRELSVDGALPVDGDPSPQIYSHPVFDGSAVRAIRREGEKWHVLKIINGKEMSEVSFTLDEARLAANEVLTDDPAAKRRPGLGRMLSAALEIHGAGAAEEGRDGR